MEKEDNSIPQALQGTAISFTQYAIKINKPETFLSVLLVPFLPLLHFRILSQCQETESFFTKYVCTEQ